MFELEETKQLCIFTILTDKFIVDKKKPYEIESMVNQVAGDHRNSLIPKT